MNLLYCGLPAPFIPVMHMSNSQPCNVSCAIMDYNKNWRLLLPHNNCEEVLLLLHKAIIIIISITMIIINVEHI